MKKISIILFMLMLLGACSGQQKYISGVDYIQINPPLERISSESGGVEVVEAFWFGCSSCYDFEPKFKKWQEEMGRKISVVKIPAPLNENWTKHAKLYWTIKELNLSNELFDKVYSEIHIERNNLMDISSIDKFLEKNNINKEAFNIAYNSRQVGSKIDYTENYFKKAQIRSVPALIIDGKYIVFENNQPEKMLDVAKFLVNGKNK